MSKYKHWSTEEKAEHLTYLIEGFQDDLISEEIFRKELAELGNNATDIEDLVKQSRPSPPEKFDGDFG